jgi:ferredoxin
VYDEYITDKRVDGLGAAKMAATECNLAENLSKFQQEIDKCILCYACRQACYGCYCKECFIERGASDWQPAKIDAGTKMTFHIGRTMHLAGRCIECGACEASCQSGVNVRYIIKEVTKFIEELYGYKAGMDAEQKPALLTNMFDDKEVGFLGGDHA